MRLLVLGGTAFLGRAFARAALDSGHHVTCAARGVTGRPPEGAHLVRVDRSAPDAYAPIAGDFDAVLDVSNRPSHVRAALSALAERVDHWMYVSSISVYSDNATPGQRPTAPTVAAAPPEVDDPEADGFAQYRPCKMACEEAVREAVAETRAFVCRPGMIAGAGDATGRFTYWVARLATGGEVLVPGGPDDAVQWVDVRDLAEWLVRVAASRTSGVYDGIGVPVPRAEFLAGIAEGVGGVLPDYTYVPHDFLTGRGINLWGGPRSLPYWFPLPEYAGILSRDTTDTLAAGLTLRPLSDTARFTHDWWRAKPPADRRLGAGLTAREEAEILEAWHLTQH